MKIKEKEILYSLIRDHEDLVGASRVTMLCLKAFIDSLRDVKCGPVQVIDLINELGETIKATEPKIIPLIHLIEEFEEELNRDLPAAEEQIKEKAIAILKSKHDGLKNRVGKVIEHGLRFVADQDSIIVHTASSDVINMLVMAREVFHRNFKVIVLKQDFAKTKRLINSLSKVNTDLLIIPEYSLSHCIGQANKMFIGALSITHDMKVVAPLGTANIVSLCHVNQLPVYLFANTLKFSHRPSSDQQIHRKSENIDQHNCRFVLTTHSHDMLDLRLVDYLITEEGSIEKKDIESYFRKKLPVNGNGKSRQNAQKAAA